MLNLALLPVLLLRISRLWIGNKRNENSDSESNDFFLSTVPAQYFRPNDSENGDDSTKNCLATNVIITSPRRCALTQRLINNVYSLYRETSYPVIVRSTPACLFAQSDQHFHLYTYKRVWKILLIKEEVRYLKIFFYFIFLLLREI